MSLKYTWSQSEDFVTFNLAVLDSTILVRTNDDHKSKKCKPTVNILEYLGNYERCKYEGRSWYIMHIIK